MTRRLEAVLDSRFVTWRDELDAFGYELESPPRPASRPNQVVVFARRPRLAGVPVTLTIDETWTTRAVDVPPGTGLVRDGCTLLMASWNAQFAQIGPPADLGAERLDVDPSKPTGLRVHRHPLGESNRVRLSLATISTPGAWIELVETLVFERFGDG